MEVKNIYTAGILNLIVMLALAVWQVHRAMTKYELYQQKPQMALTEKDLSLSNTNKENTQIHYHYPIHPTQYFLIEPAIYKHRVGIDLLATSYARNIERTIIIHLGWHQNSQEAKNTILNITKNNLAIDGRLYQPKGQLLKQPPPQEKWPKKLSFTHLEYMESLLKKSVYPQIIVTKNSALYENIANQNTLTLGITRHVCYALQFIALGIIGVYTSHKLARRKYAGT